MQQFKPRDVGLHGHLPGWQGLRTARGGVHTCVSPSVRLPLGLCFCGSGDGKINWRKLLAVVCQVRIDPPAPQLALLAVLLLFPVCCSSARQQGWLCRADGLTALQTELGIVQSKGHAGQISGSPQMRQQRPAAALGAAQGPGWPSGVASVASSGLDVCIKGLQVWVGCA